MRDYPALDTLHSPSDIRLLTISELEELAADIRNRINEIVPETGGHIGPNLGAVETIIACHYVFQLDRDRLVFDVGHQAYAHKLITGRHPSFESLRQKDGLSGYPSQYESPYDVFRSGHASTAISTALGILEGYQHMPGNEPIPKVIALVGDGSLTGGMAFEGLNHAGHLKRNLIVILNDNRMSISPTVGALSAYFNKMLHKRFVKNMQEELLKVLKKVPRVGKKLDDAAKYLIDEARHLINPGQIFTDLGFDYRGPVDGHKLEELIAVLREAKMQEVPTIVHVQTEKGKGYRPEGRHGKETLGPHAVSPAAPPDKKSTKGIPYSDAFGDKLMELAEKDKRIVAITAAMADGTGLIEFSQRFPERCYDVGICEQHALGFAAGLSSTGKRPFFAVYSTFLQRAFDQIYHELILQGRLPTVLCIDRAGLVGEDGPSHHGSFDISYLRLFPGITVMAPKDGRELGMMMEYALESDIPCAIRYPKENIPADGTFTEYTPLKSGVPEILVEGKTLLILAYGSMVIRAWEAVAQLKKEGIHVGLANGRFAKPLDTESYVSLIKNYSKVLTIEEGTVVGGYGSAVLEATQCSPSVKTHVCRLGLPDRLVEHASRSEQLRECSLDTESIIKRVKVLLNTVDNKNSSDQTRA